MSDNDEQAEVMAVHQAPALPDPGRPVHLRDFTMDWVGRPGICQRDTRSAPVQPNLCVGRSGWGRGPQRGGGTCVPGGIGAGLTLTLTLTLTQGGYWCRAAAGWGGSCAQGEGS